MSTITIVIRTDNAAFEDEDRHEAVGRILDDLGKRVCNGGWSGIRGRAILDSNGNTCGTVTVEEEPALPMLAPTDPLLVHYAWRHQD